MTSFTVDVRIVPRQGLLDPQGKAVQSALQSLEFEGLESVRVGRIVRLVVAAESERDARERIDAMCRKLLANPVTEDYTIEVRDAVAGSMDEGEAQELEQTDVRR